MWPVWKLVLYFVALGAFDAAVVCHAPSPVSTFVAWFQVRSHYYNVEDALYQIRAAGKQDEEPVLSVWGKVILGRPVVQSLQDGDV